MARILGVLLATVVTLSGVAAAPWAGAATGDGSTTAAVPNWTGGYLLTGVTGTTVRVRARNSVNFYASIDGGADVFFAGVSGTVNLTPRPLPAGTHRLGVSYRPVAPPVPSRIIEFVGDSITVGQLSSKQALTAYGWLVGERLTPIIA